MKDHFLKHIKKYASLSLLVVVGVLLFLLVSPSHKSESTPTTDLSSSDENRSFFSNLSNTIKSKKIELSVQNGDTFSSILAKAGIDYEQSKRIISSLTGVFDIKTLKPDSKNKSGDKIVIHYTDSKTENLDVIKVEIIRSALERIQVTKSGDMYSATKKLLTASTTLTRKEGSIAKGQGFIEAALASGIPYNIIVSYYDVFGFDMDFGRDLRDGDKFSILYEERYAPDGKYMGEGSMLYGSYRGTLKSMEIYRFEDEKGKVNYYNENGQGAQKALKKTPINNARISSGFGTRRHPVLGFTRAHKGVDFAAPSGTPIPSAGDGVVEFRGVKGGYGNYIKVRHNGSYSTAYAHMSRFKGDVRVGSRVKQGQIIGYVGSTGISTGAHLHYEIHKNGVQVNPITVKMPSIENLKGGQLQSFMAYKKDLETQYALLNQKFVKFMHLLSYEK